MTLFTMIMEEVTFIFTKERLKMRVTCGTDNKIDGLQSLHPTAEYHAAARAIGGCAIYVRYCYAIVDFKFY